MSPNNIPHFFILLLAFTTVVVSKDPDCVYTFFIRTGSIIKGGTDSKVSVRLYSEKGDFIEIKNLAEWGGLMGLEYSYFEKGNLDFFSGKAPCLSSPVCALNLTSDGSGSHPGWYVNYVEVNTAEVHGGCTQQKFTFEQWLAVDASPYELTAIRNNCAKSYKIGRKDGVGLKSGAFI